MKRTTWKWCLIISGAYTLCGCDPAIDVIEDILDHHCGHQDCEPIEDTDWISDTEDMPDPLAECDAALTCGGAAYPGDCIAGFELGTIQAGSLFDGFSYVGFYGYNDGSEAAAMVPMPNPYAQEPAATMLGCSPTDNFALHFQAEGFELWGAGVGVNWGGPVNPACDVDGALDCLQIQFEEPNFSLAEAAQDPRCSGPHAEEKLTCLKLGRTMLEPKDVSDYIGVGFWVLADQANEATALKVRLPIPETMRFYGGETGCNDDNDTTSDDCYNDFYTTLNLSKQDAGKWVYKQVLFDDISWNIYWGLQLDLLGISDFPVDRSMGLMIQVDAIVASGEFPASNLYIDDVMFIR